MFHAGDVAVVRAVQLATEAEAARADSLLVVAPCIMRPATLGMLVDVLASVSAAAPTLPMYYYHYPSLYNVDFSIAELLSYATTSGALPRLAGVKYIDSNMTDLGNATDVQTAAGGRYTLIATLPPLVGLAVGRGTRGAIEYTPVVPYLNKVVQLMKQGEQ
jgi:N-acetylneuraminate lyase